MPDIVVGSTYRVTLWNQLAGQAGLIILHYKAGPKIGAGGTEQNIPTAMKNAFTVSMPACLSSSATFQGVIVSRLSGTPPIVDVAGPYFSTGVGFAGGLAGDVLPTQTAGLITKRTAVPGRRGRGRAYIPFPTESYNDANGLPTNAYMTPAGALAFSISQSVLVGTLIDGNYLDPVILHRDTGGTSDILATLARQKWATQRRRGSYGRPNVSPF